MRPVHPLHNPFMNRFNDAVSHREDEMQSEEYMIWLRARDEIIGPIRRDTRMIVGAPKRLSRIVASVFGLFVLIVSFAVLLKIV